MYREAIVRVGEASGKILPSKKRKVCMSVDVKNAHLQMNNTDPKAAEQVIRQ